MADISLVPLDDRWLDDVAALVTDPAVLAFTRIPEPPPADFAQTWISSYATGRSEGTPRGLRRGGRPRPVRRGRAGTRYRPRGRRGGAGLHRGDRRARPGRGDRDPPPAHRLGLHRARLPAPDPD